jgi:Ca2+-binding RTX toxin-like protein
VHLGGGNDFVESSTGPNVLSGGRGRDLVAYLDGTDFDHQHHAVTVNLATGTSSSGDRLSGFENVLGSPEGDTLIGDDGPNRLHGYYGDDVLKGRAGDDTLIGQGGADEANGGAGTDSCWAETQTNCELPSGAAMGTRPSSAELHPWPILANLSSTQVHPMA